jgi:hypothetical protein
LVVEVAHPMRDVTHRDREPTQKIVSPGAVGIGATMAVLGLLLLPMILLAFALGGNAAGRDPTVYFPVVLAVAGLFLVRWGQRYDRTFAIAATPEKVVEKVVLWGYCVPELVATVQGTTVVFTRRRRPIWAIVFGTGWLIVLFPVGVALFPVGTLVCALGALFFLVKTRQRLTVSARPVEGGSTVTIRGEAIDALIGQMQRLMATSPTGSAIKLPASVRQDVGAAPPAKRAG